MQCPNCGYVRKPEDLTPEWQCPSCQVAYAKASQCSTNPNIARDSIPSGVTKPSSGSPISFKTAFTIALLGCVLYFGYSFFTSSTNANGTSIIDFIKSSLRSEQENKELLDCKKAELKAYEDGLQKVEEDIARNKANVGTCPITGQPNQYILTHDPRPELQAKIEKLKEEIRQLESKS